MLELFGETLWPEFTSFLKALVAGLNVPSTTLDRLRDFETKLKGLRKFSDSTDYCFMCLCIFFYKKNIFFFFL
jgi:hypothetical protein